MKKSKVMAATLLAAGTLLTGCGTATGGKTTATAGDVLGSVVGSATNPNTIGNILGSVLGINKPSTNDLYGTWNYYEPGVAFTSDNALARAGGEVAAGSIREKLLGRLRKVRYQLVQHAAAVQQGQHLHGHGGRPKPQRHMDLQ